MSTNHQIGQLLSEGATPSADDASCLTDVGAFVGAMYRRYLDGRREGERGLVGHDAWSSALTGRLSASTGARWEQGIGLGADMLMDGWSGHWDVAAGGFHQGYFGWNPADMPGLELMADDPASAPQEDGPVRRRSRKSLFGRRRATRQASAQRASRRTRAAVADQQMLKLSSGDVIAPAAYQALSDGGLWIDDLVAEIAPPVGEGVSSVVASGEGAAASQQSAWRPVWQQQPLSNPSIGSRGRSRSASASQRGTRATSSSTPRATGPAALLDGLLIDARTPALSAGLTWAEAAFGHQTVVESGLSMTSARTTEISGFAPPAQAQRGSDRRPVFAFFDSVEGDFLNLTPETAAAAQPTPAPVTAMTAARRSMFAKTVQSAHRPHPAAQNRANAGSPAGSAPSDQRPATASPIQTSASLTRVSTAPLATSLATVTPQAAPSVAPYTQGVFPTLLASGALRSGGGTRRAAPSSAFAAGAKTTNTNTALDVALAGRMGVTLTQPAASVASAVTYTPSGRPQPRMSRSQMGAPRTAVHRFAALASDMPELAALPSLASEMSALEGADAETPSSRRRAASTMDERQVSAMGAGQVGPSAWLPKTADAAFGLGAKPGPTNSRQARWVSAIDGGQDLPLGANLSAVEVASAELLRRPAFETIAEGFDSASNGAGRPMHLASSAMDGAAWVAMESFDDVVDQAPAMQSMGATARRAMGTAYPTRTNMVMVPAALAVELAAAGTSYESGLAAASSASLATAHTPQAATLFEAQTPKQTARRASASIGGAELSSEAAQVTAAARGNFLARQPTAARMMLRSGVSAAAAVQLAGESSSRRGLMVSAATAGPGRPLDGLTAASSVTVGHDSGLAPMAATSGAGGFVTLGAYEALVNSGFSQSDISALSFGSTSAAAPSAGYRRGFDATSDAAVVGLEREQIAAGGVGANVDSGGIGRPQARRGRPAAMVSPTVASRAANVAAERAQRRQLAGSGAAAKRALERPVTTARESRAVAQMVGSVVSVQRQLETMGAQSHHQAVTSGVAQGSSAGRSLGAGWTIPAAVGQGPVERAGFRQDALRPTGTSGARRELSAVRTTVPGGVESMVRAGRVHGSTGSLRTAGAGRFELASLTGVSVEQSIASLAASGISPAAHANVMATLRLAGWSEPDLQHLQLAVGGFEGQTVVDPAVSNDPHQSRQRQSMFSRPAPAQANAAADDLPMAIAASPATVSRLEASLARTVLGFEGVAMAGTNEFAGVALDASRPMAMLDGLAGDDYFGENAPAISRVASAIGQFEYLAQLPDSSVGDAAPAALGRLAALTQRSALSSSAAAASSLDGGNAIGRMAERASAARAMDIGGQLDRSLVTPDLTDGVQRAESAVDVAGDGRQPKVVAGALQGRTPKPVALKERLRGALGASSSGPAGTKRLLAQAARRQQTAATKSAINATETRRALTVIDRALAAIDRPQTGGATALRLESVLAPEILLGGIRSPKVASALATLRQRSKRVVERQLLGLGRELDASSSDQVVATSSVASFSERRAVAETGRSAAEPGMVAEGYSAAGFDPVRMLMGLTTGDSDGVAKSLTPVQRERLMSSLARDNQRGARMSSFHRAGGSSFAFEWLKRVDGTRSGIELGFDDAREDMTKTFGTQSRAFGAPLGETSLVQTGEGSAKDRSGLRRVAQLGALGRRGGDPKARRSASDAIRRTDWRFVDTGSRAATTPEIDLGKFAAAVASSGESAARVPMPLVAPAVKAVAQTALRSSKSEAAPGSSGGGGGSSKSSEAASKSEKLSERALELLAVELANRISVRLGRDRERMGIWS